MCSIVGITYRQLDYWARTDLVRPSIADARGSGTQRAYSYQDLVRLKVVKSLLDAGVKLQTARKAIEYLREDLGDDWATASLVLDGTNSVLARTDDALIDLVRRGQGVLNIVPLGHVMEELDAGIGEHVAELRVTGRLTISESLPHEQVRFAHNSERQFAKLLDFYAIEWEYEPRTFVLEARPRRQPGAGVHPRLLPPRVRPLHRDHHAQPEARHEEEPQGAPAAGAVPRGADQGALPARLPAPAREVRARAAVAARRRRPAGTAATARPRPPSRGGASGDRRVPSPRESA